MLIAFSFFTLIIILAIYRVINKERNISQEKPLWKKLVYWETILFLSIVFNIIMYINNASVYKLSSYINNGILDLLIFIVFSCSIIQLISPSMFSGKVNHGIKVFFKKLMIKDPAKKSFNNNESLSNVNSLVHNKADVYPIETNTACTNNLKEFQEKNFELFLNTLCMLSFSFVIFINIFFTIMSSIYGFNTLAAASSSEFIKYKHVQEQLDYISCVFLIFTLSIAIRQTLFYLIKLRSCTQPVNTNKEYNSASYERYMLIQKRLNKSHEKL